MARDDAPRALGLDHRDGRQRRAAGPGRHRPAGRRQALLGRRRRQGQPGRRATGRLARRRRPQAVRPRPGSHRRNPGQAREHPRLAEQPEHAGVPRAAARRWCGHCLGRRGTGARRQAAVRTSRRHRDRRVDPADRQQHHEQEDRGWCGRRAAGRQGRPRGVHEGAGPGPRAGPHDGPARRRRRRTHGLPAHLDAGAAGPRRRQRARGRRGRRRAVRRRPGRPGRSLSGGRHRDAGPRRRAAGPGCRAAGRARVRRLAADGGRPGR